MDVILKKIGDVLDADASLGTFVSSIRQHHVPEEPKKLVKPVTAYRLDSGTDEQGLHGAAVNVDVECDVWFYGSAQYPEAVQAAQRISELLVGSYMSLSSGGHLRWRESLYWQEIPQPEDAKIGLLRATFTARYWSRGRIDAVTS